MRLFIAIHLSEELTDRCLQAQKELNQMARSVRLSSQANLHLTLAFLGEIADPAPVIAAMQETGLVPFKLVSGEVSFFSSRGSPTAVLRLKDSRALFSLQKKLKENLAKRGIYYDPKPFVSHITLAREAALAGLPRLPFPETEMTVRSYELMKSERIGGELTYTPLFSLQA
jgi:2'-5' RNA ligase